MYIFIYKNLSRVKYKLSQTESCITQSFINKVRKKSNKNLLANVYLKSYIKNFEKIYHTILNMCLESADSRIHPTVCK